MFFQVATHASSQSGIKAQPAGGGGKDCLISNEGLHIAGAVVITAGLTYFVMSGGGHWLYFKASELWDRIRSAGTTQLVENGKYTPVKQKLKDKRSKARDSTMYTYLGKVRTCRRRIRYGSPAPLRTSCSSNFITIFKACSSCTQTHTHLSKARIDLCMLSCCCCIQQTTSALSVIILRTLEEV